MGRIYCGQPQKCEAFLQPKPSAAAATSSGLLFTREVSLHFWRMAASFLLHEFECSDVAGWSLRPGDSPLVGGRAAVGAGAAVVDRGLAALSAWVWVGPPLLASGASSGSMPLRSVACERRHEVPLSRLNPEGSWHRFPKQLGSWVLPAMMVPVAVTLPELTLPEELDAIVT